MPYNIDEPVLLLGAGYMAAEYANVLDALSVPFVCVGRSDAGATAFRDKTGNSALPGGLDVYLQKYGTIPRYAIVVVSAYDSAKAVLQLIESGSEHILAEKPVGLDTDEVSRVVQAAEASNTEVLAAYNRRFYAATIAAGKIIQEEGGADSAQFEFTEWLHVIKGSDRTAKEKSFLLQGNSSHVIDLAFYLCGKPKDITCFTKGPESWYGKARVYAGAGVTETGTLFSYSANWTGPGRWGLEIVAGSRRLILRPLEQLHVQEIGSVKTEQLEIDDRLDNEYKPGLYLQTQAFLQGTHREKLLSISEQLENSRLYAKIAGLE